MERQCNLKKCGGLNRSLQCYIDHAGSYAQMLCVFFIPFIMYKKGILTSTALNERIAIMTSYEFLEVLRWITIAAFGLFFIVYNLSLLFATDQMSKDKPVELGECYKKAIIKLPVFLGCIVQYIVRVLLWSLLLIIPGIIKFAQYSFAPILCINSDKSIKESFEISKNTVRRHQFSFLTELAIMLMFVFVMIYTLTDFFNGAGYLLILKNFGAMAYALDMFEGFIVLIILILPVVFIHQSFQTLNDQKERE